MKKLFKKFGRNKFNLPDIPEKISNVKISRILNATCTYCFPHGIEENNSHLRNRQRTWKKYRKKQYK